MDGGSEGSAPITGIIFHSHRESLWIDTKNGIFKASKSDLRPYKVAKKGGGFVSTFFSWGCPVRFTPTKEQEDSFTWRVSSKDSQNKTETKFDCLKAADVTPILHENSDLSPLKGTIVGKGERFSWKTAIMVQTHITGGTFTIEVPSRNFDLFEPPVEGQRISFRTKTTKEGYLSAYDISPVEPEDRPDVNKGLLTRRTLSKLSRDQKTGISIFIGELDEDVENGKGFLPFLNFSAKDWAIGKYSKGNRNFLDILEDVQKKYKTLLEDEDKEVGNKEELEGALGRLEDRAKRKKVNVLVNPRWLDRIAWERMALNTPDECAIHSIFLLEELYERTTENNFYLTNPRRQKEKVVSRLLCSEPLTRGVYSPTLGKWSFKWSLFASKCSLARLIPGKFEPPTDSHPKVKLLPFEDASESLNDQSSVFLQREKPTVLAAIRPKDDQNYFLKRTLETEGRSPLTIESAASKAGWRVYECTAEDDGDAQDLSSSLLTLPGVFAITTSHFEGENEIQSNKTSFNRWSWAMPEAPSSSSSRERDLEPVQEESEVDPDQGEERKEGLRINITVLMQKDENLDILKHNPDTLGCFPISNGTFAVQANDPDLQECFKTMLIKKNVIENANNFLFLGDNLKTFSLTIDRRNKESSPPPRYTRESRDGFISLLFGMTPARESKAFREHLETLGKELFEAKYYSNKNGKSALRIRSQQQIVRKELNWRLLKMEITNDDPSYYEPGPKAFQVAAPTRSISSETPHKTLGTPALKAIKSYEDAFASRKKRPPSAAAAATAPPAAAPAPAAKASEAAETTSAPAAKAAEAAETTTAAEAAETTGGRSGRKGRRKRRPKGSTSPTSPPSKGNSSKRSYSERSPPKAFPTTKKRLQFAGDSSTSCEEMIQNDDSEFADDEYRKEDRRQERNLSRRDHNE